MNALRKGPDGDHVFVIAPDKEGKPRAQMRSVESGTMLGDEVLILAGLSPGEQVAASGSFKLRETALVAIAGEREAGQRAGRGRASPNNTSPRGVAMRSFTDIFIKHPVLAVVINLVIVLAGLRVLTVPAGATISADRELVRGNHDALLRRQR